MIPWRYTVETLRTKSQMSRKFDLENILTNSYWWFSNIHELVCSINELKLKTKLVNKMVKAFTEKKLGFRRQRACGRDRPRNISKIDQIVIFGTIQLPYQLLKSIIGLQRFFHFVPWLILMLLEFSTWFSSQRKIHLAPNLLEKMSKCNFLNKLLSLVS